MPNPYGTHYSGLFIDPDDPDNPLNDLGPNSFYHNNWSHPDDSAFFQWPDHQVQVNPTNSQLFPHQGMNYNPGSIGSNDGYTQNWAAGQMPTNGPWGFFGAPINATSYGTENQQGGNQTQVPTYFGPGRGNTPVTAGTGQGSRGNWGSTYGASNFGFNSTGGNFGYTPGGGGRISDFVLGNYINNGQVQEGIGGGIGGGHYEIASHPGYQA